MTGHSPSLFTAINAASGRRFMHHDLAEPRTLGLQFLPEPCRHLFNCWVLQPLNFIEVRVVQYSQKRRHRCTNLGMIINPPRSGIDISFDRNLYFETMAMHSPAFMTLRRLWQNLRCFKSKIFSQTRSHNSDSPLCWRPDELVHLKLKTDVEPIGQNPFHDFARIDPAKNRREQNGVTASGQIEPVNVLP